VKRLWLIGVCLLFCITSISGGTQAIEWSVETLPEFVFIGDEVDVAISGLPATVCIFEMYYEGTPFLGKMVTTDKVGVARFNISIPIDADPGLYDMIVVTNGENVTSGQLEVLFDEMIYQQYLIDKLRRDLDYQSERNDLLADTVLEMREKNDFVFAIGLFGGAFSALTLLILATSLSKVYLYIWGKEKDKNSIKRLALAIRPRAKGDLSPYVEWIGANLKRTKERKRAEKAGLRYDLTPTAFIPSSSSPNGIEAIELDEVDMDGLREEHREAIRHYSEMVLDHRNEDSGKKKEGFMDRIKRRRKKR